MSVPASLLAALRQSALGILGSKKFLGAIVTMIVWAAGRWGFALDVAEVTAWVSPIVAAIVGQGLADFGTSRRPANDNIPPATPAPATSEATHEAA